MIKCTSKGLKGRLMRSHVGELLGLEGEALLFPSVCRSGGSCPADRPLFESHWLRWNVCVLGQLYPSFIQKTHSLSTCLV